MNYKSVIESKYNRKNWQELLHDIFGNKAELYEDHLIQTVYASNDIARHACYLGKI